MVAVPYSLPVTKPEPDTVAISSSDDDHVKSLLLMVLGEIVGVSRKVVFVLAFVSNTSVGETKERLLILGKYPSMTNWELK